MCDLPRLTCLLRYMEQASFHDLVKLACELAGAATLAQIRCSRLCEAQPESQMQAWVSAKQLAQKSGHSARYWTDRAPSLPFAKRASPRRWRFDLRGWERWMEGGHAESLRPGHRLPVPSAVPGRRRAHP